MSPRRKSPSFKRSKLCVVSQKNALQLLLQRHVGYIEVEKKYNWLKTPDRASIASEYNPIIEALSSYRENDPLGRANFTLLCDIVLEEHKLIIEYDEYQHFSQARKISLQNYPENISLYFSKEAWIQACEEIDAHDNNPHDRDEKRALYDAVRDIEAYRHGYRLVRIKHGDVDWSAPEAKWDLLELIPFIK